MKYTYIVNSDFALPHNQHQLADDTTLLEVIKRMLDLSPVSTVQVIRKTE